MRYFMIFFTVRGQKTPYYVMETEGRTGKVGLPYVLPALQLGAYSPSAQRMRRKLQCQVRKTA